MVAYEINQRLAQMYGNNVTINKPNFRIIWSDDELEKRYSEYSDAGVYLGKNLVVREMKKYNYFPRPCWILEKLFIVNDDFTHDKLAASYSYEPFLAMIDGNYNPLPLAWRPVEVAIQYWLNLEEKFKTEADLEADKLAHDKKESARVLEMLDEGEISDALRYKEAVAFGGVKKLEVKDGTTD